MTSFQPDQDVNTQSQQTSEAEGGIKFFFPFMTD